VLRTIFSGESELHDSGASSSIFSHPVQSPGLVSYHFVKMGLDWEVAHYIVCFHAHLMTDAERRAQRHLFATMKCTNGRSDRAAQKEALNSKLHSRDLSNDPDVLRLTTDGYEAFELRTADRILQEYGDRVLLNCCPKCGQLARTPTASQCRFCKYDWHDSA
jgi:hypothetical protein